MKKDHTRSFCYIKIIIIYITIYFMAIRMSSQHIPCEYMIYDHYNWPPRARYPGVQYNTISLHIYTVKNLRGNIAIPMFNVCQAMVSVQLGSKLKNTSPQKTSSQIMYMYFSKKYLPNVFQNLTILNIESYLFKSNKRCFYCS